MKDIDLAKAILEKDKLALVIVKEEEVIFYSKEKGIKPIYMAVNTLKDQLVNSSVADRVIGKAAAMLCKYSNIKALHTKLISESAMEVLEKENIILTYDESAPYIKNRDKTDLCPVEKLSSDIENTNLLLEKITDFLESIQKKK
ncbi:DUF1893 domain-containing protein [Lutibacter sp. B2]|nr:DUF1893 domain-containing protein [Lutibacter sp. B2]